MHSLLRVEDRREKRGPVYERSTTGQNSMSRHIFVTTTTTQYVIPPKMTVFVYTARRHRQGGRSEVTVTSEPHTHRRTKKDDRE